MKKIYLFSTIVFILFSCTKEVVIPIDQSKAKLVVNGLFNTDSLWKIEVSASRYIYDTTSLPLINDANVTITDQDNNSLQLSNQGQGIYTSNIENPEELKIIIENLKLEFLQMVLFVSLQESL